ncbi:MAG: hypothetical protein KJ041_01215 [Gammaproteobacteria bacterium]|nr:hypothetical protein [Gammaproteobacteria bacterium]
MPTHNSLLHVPSSWLYLFAGGLWVAVAILMCAITIPWLTPLSGAALAGVLVSGLVIAALISRFGFSRLVRRNIRRLDALGERASVFAFQPGKSYLVILLMMAIGWTLRHSPLPKPALAAVYIGIGGGLLLSGLGYFRR